jgi:hypothetical protein
VGAPGVPFGLRLQEVFVGDPDYIVLQNHADCAIGLSQFAVRFSTEGVATPLDAALDSRLLVAGANVYVSETPSQAGDVHVGTIPNTGDLAGTVQLCLGSCATGSTLDVIAWNGTVNPAPALPSPITFTPANLDAITVAKQSNTSYLRSAVTGNDPRFFAADWTTGASSR